MDESKKAKILEQFGETLRAERLKAGLSQEHLADLAELDRTYVGSTERGERNISLINISLVLKTRSPFWLISFYQRDVLPS